MQESKSSEQRIVMLDVARFFGMVLVYYGHIVEQSMYLGNAAAAAQYKWIYSFHMPFFLLLSGFAAGQAKAGLPVRAFLRREAASRLVPYVFFTMTLLASTFFLTGWFPMGALDSGRAYCEGLVRTLLGFPAFNIPTWFMALLVSTEIVHRMAGPFLRTTPRLALAAVACYLGGYYLNLHVAFVRFDMLWGWNYWFLHEVPVAYAFYLTGVLMRRHGFLLGAARPVLLAGGALACAAFVQFTFNLNQGPFRLIQAVVIVLSGHGHVLWFPVTALAGSLLVLLLARLAGPRPGLAWLGENALALFCLNGVFYHYVNPVFAKWGAASLPGDWWALTAATAAGTVASLGLCVPLVWLLRTYLPQLVGRPGEDGPLLPRLV